jgi:hypothetical protein
MAFKTTSQRELDSYCKNINEDDFSVRAVTKSAFSQARAKINPLAFKHLSRIALGTFYREAPAKNRKNMRVLACDGTKLMLPRHKTIVQEFGVQYVGPNANASRHMALASILYDTENLVPTDSQIASYEHSEKDLLKKQLNCTRKGERSQKINRTSAVSMLQQILLPSFIPKKSNQRFAHLMIWWPKHEKSLDPTDPVHENTNRPKGPT